MNGAILQCLAGDIIIGQPDSLSDKQPQLPVVAT
jgi:hypothetical protein